MVSRTVAPVQHVEANRNEHHAASHAKGVDRDAKEFEDFGPRKGDDGASDSRVGDDLQRGLALFSLIQIVSQTQKDRQVDERVHHRKQGAEHGDGKAVDHGSGSDAEEKQKQYPRLCGVRTHFATTPPVRADKK